MPDEREVRFSHDSMLDLFEAWWYLSSVSPAAAARFLIELRESIDQLSVMPGMGHHREDLTSRAFRFWRVGRYFIIYDADDQALRIARIIHSSRDVAALFGDPGPED
jgi:plasmid stabilization system protein ParE